MSAAQEGEHSAFIKTPTQLVVVVILAFVVPIAVIFTIIHFALGGDPSRNTSAMSDKEIAARIAPVGSTPEIDDKTPSPLLPAPVPVTVAAVGANANAGPDGKAIYQQTCQACHAAGVAGAPKLGDKAAWGPRIGAGAAALVNAAIKGKNAMPAKGGNPTLSDADIKAAVDYMVSQSK